MRARVATVVALMALLGAGCGDNDSGGGGGDAPGSPREAAEAYIEAQKAGDTGRVCELYSDAYLEVTEEEGGPCEDFDERSDKWNEEDRELLEVEERGDDKAVAIVSCEDSTASDCSLPLVEEGGGWKVDSGLHPNDGVPVEFTTE